MPNCPNPTARKRSPSSHLHDLATLILQIIPDSTLQLRCPIPKHTRQILQIIASGNPEAPHNVLGRGLEIAVLASSAGTLFVFWTAKVCVGGDGLGAFETLQAGFGFGLGGWIEAAFAEELVGRDAFLCAELFAGVAF